MIMSTTKLKSKKVTHVQGNHGMIPIEEAKKDFMDLHLALKGKVTLKKLAQARKALWG